MRLICLQIFQTASVGADPCVRPSFCRIPFGMAGARGGSSNGGLRLVCMIEPAHMCGIWRFMACLTLNRTADKP